MTSSPLKFPATSGFEAAKIKRDSRRTRISQEMSGKFIGLIPVAQFLDDFLEKAPTSTPSIVDAFKNVPARGPEKHMYKPFIDAVEKHNLIPGFRIIDASTNEDRNSNLRLKLDVNIYKAGVDLSIDKVQFDKMELNIEFKANENYEPFDNQPKRVSNMSFESSSIAGQLTRGQFTEYTNEIFSRQHRCFLFAVFICGPFARLLRWDHAGAVVSEQFNYISDSRLLVDFLWRFSHLSDERRGLDQSVRVATRKETELAKAKLSKWIPKRSIESPVVVFTVPGENGEHREFIAWTSMTTPHSVTGRFTRAYPVYEIATDKCYFLKDLWRAHDLDPEADILRELAEQKVEHVPKFECGDDIFAHATESDLYVPIEVSSGDSDDDASSTENNGVNAPPARREHSWAVNKDLGRVIRRIHHRFVVDFIGRPLHTFKNSKQLMQVVYDAFIAHQQAYQRCNLLIHRDVSAKNILIDENGRGVLNDWDLAKHEGELKRRRRHEKTGTWQFMSCLILQRHHSIHTIQDDMESFIYVMLYHALRYLEHNLRDPPTPDILGQIFDYAILKPDGTFYGGSFKETLFVSSTYLGSQSGFAISSVPFQSWWRWAHKAASRWILHHIAKTEPVDELLSDIDEDDPPPPTISVEKLKFRDHTAMSQVFAKCLASNRWPVNERPPVDAVPDADIESSSVNLKRPSGSVGPLDDGGSADGSRKRSQLSDRSWKVRSEPVQFPSHTMITRGRVNRGISHEPVKR